MSRYIIRLELEGDASWQTYTAIHDALEARNVRRRIQDTTSGTWFKLPDATYVCTSQLTTAEVRDEVELIVRPFWTDIHLIVANYNDAAFQLRMII